MVIKTLPPYSQNNDPADFETAISFTKLGKFNIILFLTIFPAALAAQFESTSLSYVFPAAQCNLNLTLEDKGLLNAIFYIGMTLSAFMWGHIIDTYGRKKTLVYGFLIDAIFVLMSAFSQHFLFLVIAKFFGGFIINGPSTSLPAYLSEFHEAKYRSRVPLAIGLTYGLASILLPLLGLVILTTDINYILFNTNINFHAWNIFLFISALAPIISAIIYSFLPESPKYLMTKGFNNEALNIFRKIYKINTGLTNYPINKLIEEKQNIKENVIGLKQLWMEILILFSPPHIFQLILVCIINTFLMTNINTIRLWLPQIFQVINDFNKLNGTETNFCNMLILLNINTNSSIPCTVNLNNSSVYTNSMIIAAITMIGYLSIGSIINIFGKKKILFCLSVMAGFSILALYFSNNNILTLSLITINNSCICICVDILTTIIIDLFPTNLRGTALSLAFMCGRIGSFNGNLIFPLLLQYGCIPSFFTLGLITISCSIVIMLLRNIKLKPLE